MNSAMARLEVVAGRAIGMSILIDDELLIGRHAEGAGRLADDEEISRSHARLSLDRTGFCAIEDLGSTNGTYVNGMRIKGPETTLRGRHDRGRRDHPGGARAADPAFGAHAQGDPVATYRRPRRCAAPAPDKTPAAGRHHVRASEALEQGGASGQRQGPVTTENPRSKAAKPADKQAQLPENLSLKLEIDWDARKATLSVGDEKPLKLVLDGDTWRPLSDAG